MFLALKIFVWIFAVYVESIPGLLASQLFLAIVFDTQVQLLKNQVTPPT
jgi:hypothetical protein